MKNYINPNLRVSNELNDRIVILKIPLQMLARAVRA